MNNTFELKDWNFVGNEFYRLFGVKFYVFFDEKLSLCFKAIKINNNFFKFIEDKIEGDESISDCIVRIYGVDAQIFISKLL